MFRIFLKTINNTGHIRGGTPGTQTQGRDQGLNVLAVTYPGRIPDHTD